MAVPTQSNTTFEEINQLIYRYLLARDWHQLAPKDLAVSISLEANELLEHYQWSDAPVGNHEALASELADVFIYAFEFAQVNNIDIADAITKKLAAAEIKYPAEKFKGKSLDERTTAWRRHHEEGRRNK